VEATLLSFEQPLSRSELARALDISRVTLLRYERQGLIPAADRVAPNRSIFWPEAQMIAANLVEARS
jgi:predicted site-specific integrase-resolvase